MIEKKLAIRPSSPTTLMNPLTKFWPPYAAGASSASTSGLPDSLRKSEPAAPGATRRMTPANTIRASIAAMMPRGMSLAGFFDSSAASGTPSTAKKNQMA